MKKSDLGIVIVHWILVVVLLGAATSGICLWKKELQPKVAFIFEAGKVASSTFRFGGLGRHHPAASVVSEA